MKATLTTRFALLVSAIVAAFLCCTVAWEAVRGEEQTEAKLIQEARALASNMDAVWDFMTLNQDRINYDSQGNFEFKGLQCSIAGRSVGSLFSRGTDYSIRYVSDAPRNRADMPTDFEQAALDAFRNDPTLIEYYELTEEDGARIFRYLKPMKLEASCLECHGEPAGTMDVSGYVREGLPIDYVYGALSLDIPATLNENAARENAVANVVFTVALMIICAAVIAFAISRLVTHPLKRIQGAMEAMATGSYSARLDINASAPEMRVLADGFNDMAEKLEQSHEHLEEVAAQRTVELKQANIELEKQSAELEAANQRLRDENQYKNEFLAMMSHELRTPLAASMAFTEILKDHAARSNGGKDGDDQLWQEVEANHKTLLSMINNLLEMARIDAGRETLRLEVADIGDLVGLVQTTIDPLAAKNGIRLEYRVGEVPLFVADLEKLYHLMENLLSNAIKFTPEGGTVALDISHHPEWHRISIAVSDTGCGIAEDQRATIFERFVQADSSACRSHGGSGLGLALVKEFAEMHGGSVTLESEVGEGSTFTVLLPDDLSTDDPLAPPMAPTCATS